MKSRNRIIWIWVAGILTLAILLAADLSAGGLPSVDILKHLRLPRAVTAILAGIALSLSGAQMQSIFHNPLADPYIMGISAGAALGAAVATLTGTNNGIPAGLTIAASASSGALLSAIIILAVSKKFKSAGELLIFGIMMSFIVNATIPILQAGAESESLKLYYSWSSGSFSNTTWLQTAMMLTAVIIGTITALFNTKELDIIIFGDDFASMAGADPGRIRMTALISSSIMTGTITAFCGPIGFVGIIAPHIAGYVFSTASHRTKLPGTMLTGSIICIAADLLSRTGETPIPIASTMAFVGIPVVVYMLLKRPII